MKDWHEIARLLATNGLSNSEIAHELIRLGVFEKVSYTKVYDRVRKYLKYHSNQPKSTPNQPTTVTQNFNKKEHHADWKGLSIIRFGLIGDTHINSKYTQLEALNSFYDYCSANGVSTVYHTGDIDDGYKMRIGHENELYTVGADNHVSEIVKNYPKVKGVTTYFICGNHDASIYKNCGYDIGPAIAREREDMKYLGRDTARVMLTSKCSLDLRHPWDATGTAISSRIQKMIDMSDDRPDILAVGHYHKAEQLFYRNVFAFQTASFQSDTPFTIGRGISTALGGWVVEVEVDKSGKLVSCSGKFIPFEAIKDDYKNYERA